MPSAIGEEVIWTTSNPLIGSERTRIDAFLDGLYALPHRADRRRPRGGGSRPEVQ